MNESGKAVHALLRKYPTLTPNDFLIVHDDLEHKIGNVRVKEGGVLSTHVYLGRGHNGVDSVAKFLGTNSFKRLQLGISRPESRDP
jgi:PTH1 family peptidyl-tRNA hydrolase